MLCFLESPKGFYCKGKQLPHCVFIIILSFVCLELPLAS
jgi:hypothetical protein